MAESLSKKSELQLAKSFILWVYDDLARHRAERAWTRLSNLVRPSTADRAVDLT